MKRRTGMEEEKDSYRMCMNEFVCARMREESTPPYLTLTRDLGAWHHVYSRVQTALLHLTDSNPPPLPPLFLALKLFLFCFHKQQKGRQGFIKAGDIHPSPSPICTTWMGRSHKWGGSHRITLPRSPSHIHTHHHYAIIHQRISQPSLFMLQPCLTLLVPVSQKHSGACHQIWLDIRFKMSLSWLSIMVYYSVLMTSGIAIVLFAVIVCLWAGQMEDKHQGS